VHEVLAVFIEETIMALVKSLVQKLNELLSDKTPCAENPRLGGCTIVGAENTVAGAAQPGLAQPDLSRVGYIRLATPSNDGTGLLTKWAAWVGVGWELLNEPPWAAGAGSAAATACQSCRG
jgi:hypothetical protein